MPIQCARGKRPHPCPLQRRLLHSCFPARLKLRSARPKDNHPKPGRTNTFGFVISRAGALAPASAMPAVLLQKASPTKPLQPLSAQHSSLLSGQTGMFPSRSRVVEARVLGVEGGHSGLACTRRGQFRAKNSALNWPQIGLKLPSGP